MYDFLPHGGPLPPGYGDVYGAPAGGRSVTPSAAALFSTVRTPQTVQQAVASQAFITKARQSSGASSTSPLAIPDFDTWNVGAGMIEKVPAKKEIEEPWYMNKALWAVGGVTALGLGYFLFFRKKAAPSGFAGFGA
jgi:hypothetical protein